MAQSATPNETVNEKPLDANTPSDQVGQAAEKPSEPKEPQPVNSAAASAKSELHATIQNLNANKTSFENEHREVNYYFDEKHGLLSAVISSFTFNDIWRITKEKQKEIASLFVADSVEVERLRSLLAEKRVLILSGETGLGKTTTAIYLGSLVSGRDDAEDVEAMSHETYLIPSLGRYVKIDLNEICECADVPSNRFVIFKNALTSCNHDLLGFFAQLNQFSLGEFADKLRKDNSYLIFTITSSEAAQLQTNLVDKDLHYELKHLSDELLSKGLNLKLTQLSQSPQIATKRLKHLQEPQQQRLMIARLRTMRSIVRFTEYYLRDSGATEIEVDLDEAMRRFEDITYWFHRDLIGDFEAWCFTLSLGLSHCLHETQGVSWVDFEHLRRAVWQCLKRDPELFPPKFSLNDQPLAVLSEKPPALIDDIYLEKCRAEILKDPNSLVDLIRFSDDSYSQKLWEILLKHHRRILTMLLPRLREMAEDHSGKYDPRQRALCARIIGRIGEIDPDRISLTLMSRWIYSDDVRHRSTIGALYQGILASKDERYRNYFIELLKSLTAFDNTSVDNEDEKNRLLTSISIYSQLGTYDLSLAIKGLERIAREKLVHVMQDVQRIGRLIERTQNEFPQQSSAEEAMDLLIYQKRLSDLAERLYAQQGSTFVGVQYALCSLSLNTDPISVFRELRKWIESSNQATGVLVALMFLIRDGIATTLGSRQVEISNNESTSAERKTCNPMIVALTSGQESVMEMARFLVTIFESFSAKFIFPKEFMRYLRESFLFHLRTWVEESLPIESCSKAMENLFIELMRIHKGILFEPIYQLLNNPEFSKKEPDLKKGFVDAVLWQRH